MFHGHNDHTNGLKYLTQVIDLSHVEVISHPHCFCPKTEGGEWIGAPYSATEMETLCRYRPSVSPRALSDELLFLGEIPSSNDFEKRNGIGQINIDGKWHTDYNMDDTALVYKGEEGLFIITGCSHSGICNIAAYARKVLNENTIAGIIGGFHLLTENDPLDKTIRYLMHSNVTSLYPCHCVSLKAKCKMSEMLNLTEVGAGLQIEIL